METSKCPVEVSLEDLLNNPRCSHGPTLRFIENGRTFYACSAYRNRKYCRFYMTDQKWSKIKRNYRCDKRKSAINMKSISANLNIVKKSTQHQRCFCHTCSVLFVSSLVNHSDHEVTSNLSLNLIQTPSKILRPLQEDKKEAQYFFTQQAINSIVEIILKNNFRNVLCLGTPTIHEYLKKKLTKVKSLLLDIDERYRNFYDEEFCQFNLFNNYFFDEEEKNDIFKIFLKNSRELCIVVDPPFGGRMEPIQYTLSKITHEYNNINKSSDSKLLPTIVVLPYFMESHVKNYFPSMNMTDYQVTYENHNAFSIEKNKKTGSPIRLYTNIPLDKVPLPVTEGYSFCRTCSKWIGKWNQHCPKCNACCSKNGSTYIHCNDCNKCTKPTWKHCFKCEKCTLENHLCQKIQFTKKCLTCNLYGHKKSECQTGSHSISDDYKQKTSVG